MRENMLSNKLKEAREYERKYLEEKGLDDRPLFHATGTVGWINDPNGFCRYNDEYHLFYQYYPYDRHWGPMHWGHSVSKDLIKWQYLPCAIAPDEEYDKDGCFSGSAIETPDGKLLLVYTGVIKKEEADGTERDYQQQCVAIGDGVDFEKVEINPVIPTEMIPAGNDIHDFRDPKIIKNGDKYYCFTVNRHADNSGQVLVYESTDGLKWSFAKVLDMSENKVGGIWECPDYFDLDGKRILIVSPQETKGDGENIFPGFNNFFLVGQGKDFLDFNRQTVQPIDLGTDFYAAQTVETADGKRVMIGWMQNWETCNYENDKHDYYGMMTMPRELRIKDGIVYQNPLKELSNYYKDKVSYNNVVVEKEISLDKISGRIFDMTLDITPEDKAKSYDFGIKLAKDLNYETTIVYDSKHHTITLDRNKSGVTFGSLGSRTFKVDSADNHIKLRIVMDKYALEVFVNDGKQAAAMKIDTPIQVEDISFFSDEKLSMNIVKYDFDLTKF